MSSLKRKRLEDPLILQPTQVAGESLVQGNSYLQQPIILGPVVDHGKQILENSHIHVMNNSNIIATDPNGQSNTFIVVPQNGGNSVDNTQTILQSIPVYLLVPRQQPDKVSDEKVPSLPGEESAETNAAIVIKDVRTIKNEDEENEHYPETIYLDSIDDNVNDPLILPLLDENTVGKDFDGLKHRSLYKCDFPDCPKTFLYPHERKVHKDVHIFPVCTEYKCSICNMSFAQAADRNKHVESHSVAHTYSCSVCDSNFPYYTTLIQHMNEKCCVSKSFKCRYCNIPFASEKDVHQHEEKLHISYSKDKLGVQKLSTVRRYSRLQRPLRHTKKRVSTDSVIVLD